MSKSVADRVEHKMPRPVRCDECGSPNVELQSRKLMGMHVKGPWDLIWHCADCLAFVGCHEGTDIPMGLMADRDTREARYRAHRTLDPMWKGRNPVVTRQDIYTWMSAFLAIPPERAHISMLNLEQCERLIAAAPTHFRPSKLRLVKGRPKQHWKHTNRKRRRD